MRTVSLRWKDSLRYTIYGLRQGSFHSVGLETGESASLRIHQKTPYGNVRRFLYGLPKEYPADVREHDNRPYRLSVTGRYERYSGRLPHESEQKAYRKSELFF